MTGGLDRLHDAAAVRAVAEALAGQGGRAWLVKLAVRRARPDLPGLPPVVPTLSNRSYPSAHATTSAAGARALAPLLPAPPLYALAGVLALSRPYLGVHWPSDALAGAALGTAVATLVS